MQDGGRVRVQVIHDAGIRLQVFKGNGGLGRQRVVFVDEHGGDAGDEFMKFQTALLKHSVHEFPVVLAHEQHAQFTFAVRHLLDDLGVLSDEQLIGVGVHGGLFLQHGQRVDHKAVMLAADVQLLMGVADLLLEMLRDLVRVLDETIAHPDQLLSLRRQGDTGAGTDKDGNPQFLLHRADHFADAGLRDIQRLRGLAEGAAFCDHGNVFQLQERHGVSFLSLVLRSFLHYSVFLPKIILF